MPNNNSDRNGLIGCAIGTAVISLLANGHTLSKENIIYELERLKGASSDLQVKSISKAAADILRKGEQ
ncbi:hypothetical protein CQW29_11405 [Pantoea coffeiphila]|uniref:Uncharacterized protein n=1 Tax=Pantoea coffeiphila TaxID=1465635 RepID=A0A2S9ICT1_9GAMM|nr:hypothetical protein CQW29_11405 [Pantoea coffeiphila]